MAKGEKWKALWAGLSSSNRFWGGVVFVAGCGITFIPGLQVIGAATAALGAQQVLIGATNARRRQMVRDGKIPPTMPNEPAQDSSES